jgi:peptide/nickel transport system ATP-binding protein
MYAGRIAEIGPVREVLGAARHPYTAGLMGAIPKIRRAGAQRAPLVQIEGAMPRLNAIPPGCAFNPRCAKCFERCRRERPELRPTGPNLTACWLYDERPAPAAA